MIQRKENKIGLLWEELEYFLENDEEFQIVMIEDKTITIKALKPLAFRKECVYCKILSRIIPTRCRFELCSDYIKAEDSKRDSFIFDFSIITESKLFYQGEIIIIKE